MVCNDRRLFSQVPILKSSAKTHVRRAVSGTLCDLRRLVVAVRAAEDNGAYNITVGGLSSSKIRKRGAWRASCYPHTSFSLGVSNNEGPGADAAFVLTS